MTFLIKWLVFTSSIIIAGCAAVLIYQLAMFRCGKCDYYSYISAYRTFFKISLLCLASLTAQGILTNKFSLQMKTKIFLLTLSVTALTVYLSQLSSSFLLRAHLGDESGLALTGWTIILPIALWVAFITKPWKRRPRPESNV